MNIHGFSIQCTYMDSPYNEHTWILHTMFIHGFSIQWTYMDSPYSEHTWIIHTMYIHGFSMQWTYMESPYNEHTWILYTWTYMDSPLAEIMKTFKWLSTYLHLHSCFPVWIIVWLDIKGYNILSTWMLCIYLYSSMLCYFTCIKTNLYSHPLDLDGFCPVCILVCFVREL